MCNCQTLFMSWVRHGKVPYKLCIGLLRNLTIFVNFPYSSKTLMQIYILYYLANNSLKVEVTAFFSVVYTSQKAIELYSLYKPETLVILF